MNGSLPVVEARNLSKTYWLYPNQYKRLLGSFINPRRIPGAFAFNALSDLNFELYPGDAIALIGKNGAGKSTALQLLTGVVRPTGGEYITRGRVCALLELGSGFNPDYTGKENVYLNGALLGFSKQQIDEHFDAIASFADIGKFLEQPVRTYSSGMFVRLAFAVQACLEPDILIVDEALAVGDIFFQQKCHAHIERLKENGTAVILVTHDMSAVLKYCANAILLEHGKTIYQGDVQVATRIYYNSFAENSEVVETASNITLEDIQQRCPNDASPPELEKEYNGFDFFRPAPQALIDHTQATALESEPGATRFLGVAICDSKGRACHVFEQGQSVHFYWYYELLRDWNVVSSSLTLIMQNNIPLYTKNFIQAGKVVPNQTKKGSIVYCHQLLKLDIATGPYTFDICLSEYPKDFYKNQHIYSKEVFLSAAKPVCYLNNVGVITIIHPKKGIDVPFCGIVDICEDANIQINNQTTPIK